MLRHFRAILGLRIPCRHGRQAVAGGRRAGGFREMFVVCCACGKRLSPGVVLGPEAVRAATRSSPGAIELVTAASMIK
ncbi:MAG TPA: hypothetical protein VKT29_09580 [Terriglobales bacterium]|nr:hypothetical protein [Terriglobales bacterium]